MPLIHILKGYLLNKGSTMKPKGKNIVELGLTGRWDEMKAIVDVDREGHEKIAPPSQLLVMHEESSTIMQKLVKKAKKEKMVKEKKEKIIEDLVLKRKHLSHLMLSNVN
jgi:hypothetical protein